MYIAHNIFAMNAQRQYKISSNKSQKSTEKLSSGYRINRAADDAAGLTISEKMRRQIRGLDRASDNCQDGISLVQVADGALTETHSILQRMNELAIQSANGTNSTADRAAIDSEKKELVSELNRIANTTTFNGNIYPLRGTSKEIPMKTITYADVNFDDVKLLGSGSVSDEVADTYVGWSPFEEKDNFDSLKLQAVIDDKNHEFPTDTYNFLFNNGGTAKSKIRITNASDAVLDLTSPEQYEVDMDQLTYEGDYNFDEANKTWTRSFSWTSPNGDMGIRVRQTVRIDDTNKNYIITNGISSTGTVPALFEFMMNMDTAYNNDDVCEGYFTNGTEVTHHSIFNTDTTENGLFQKWLDGTMSSYVYGSDRYPDSLSIVNRDFQDLLPFTEKIDFSQSAYKPIISLGAYYKDSAEWDYFKTTGPAQGLGENATGKDRTTTLIWSTGTTATALATAVQHAEYDFSFTYGVDNVKKDANLPTTQTKTFRSIQVPDLQAMEGDAIRIWAGTSSDVENGIYLNLVDATAEALGVSDVDFSTETGATKAINKIKDAIAKTSSYRSYFGAVQNRMEHTINNIDNISENTSSSESRIRDTDMAKEMVEYSKNNILMQTGQSMITQANQLPQGVLSLLQ